MALFAAFALLSVRILAACEEFSRLHRRADIPVRSTVERKESAEVFTAEERSGVAADRNVRAPAWLRLCRAASLR